MGGRKDIYKDAKGFDKNPQNINRSGANRKSISTVNLKLQEEGYEAANKNDIVDCYLRLVNVDIPKIEKLIQDDDQPAIVRIVGKEILSGKGFDVIEKLLDRSIGKPQQSTDITTNGKEISNQQLPTDTINKLIDKL